eukprot:scaffold51376_cov62-Phaeocystis_antarctica.AAC.2
MELMQTIEPPPARIMPGSAALGHAGHRFGLCRAAPPWVMRHIARNFVVLGLGLGVGVGLGLGLGLGCRLGHEEHGRDV